MFYAGIAALIAVFLALFVWSFTTVYGVVDRYTDLTGWEFAAIVFLVSIIFGSTSASRSRD